MNRQEPIIGSVIPAISPTASVLFDKLFWPNVVSKDSEGNPLNGSMGFGWVDPVVVGDLRVAHQRFKSCHSTILAYERFLWTYTTYANSSCWKENR